ncbi:SprT family zinc-dependent metalloprotease [Phycisphaera mikurensis]|uniref:SprT-like domain-containing protein n=1 Tax=Phycisphaera mikurensis (strain NBRC 102666 / KCTC 22515 / FYK2301M01) TaxID=1142394 RepID=I0IJ38_PHYMF|nr:SprT-like domain-containing protein [Phycisphaera mikurensis]MBB6443123.1 putative SprT family Zn-dependent metalloprotease [Phycisphaera mikurensis]BAM05276.1 hypothetical protein PSMK_31170 [Phycisphaera mikurensis NBRC 102666]
MDLPSSGQLAERLMREHGLLPGAGQPRTRKHWTFGFNNRKRCLGLCRFDAKRIELSAAFVQRNDEPAVRDTVLHEIAHALAGARAGHGQAWRDACVRVGAKPERLDREADMPEGRWRAVCPGCGQVHTRHRRPARGARYHCRACGAARGPLVFAAGAP